ncbi:PRTRC system protein E [Lamprocystis purpurea]|jgi:PRTRC genetic system protein E|uniref:PRTRC system protein E n=1 Tax=Lamprocystis purpurea TaxID=61598 RepID=UPI00037390C7|nr:PRTRC system protein E [Lamprocystis purpurea]
MALFEHLAGVLTAGERLRFEIARNPDGGLTVLVQPLMITPVEHLAGDTASLRAALAMPLRITGSVAELDARLPAMLVTYGERRQDVAMKVTALETLKEAGKAGARLVEQGKQAAGASAVAAAPLDPTPTSVPAPVLSAPAVPVDPNNLFA